MEPSWNRRGTVLRMAFCGMEPSGTVVEPSRNRPVCYVFPHAWRLHTALIIILLKPIEPEPRIAVKNFSRGSGGAGLFWTGTYFNSSYSSFGSRINNKIKEATHRLLPANPKKHNVYFQLLLSATSDQFEHQSMFIDYSSHLKYPIRRKACMGIFFTCIYNILSCQSKLTNTIP